jgi:pantothenate kinase-related protein Tda10
MIFGGTLEYNIRLFADYCTIYRKINDSSDIDKLQKDLNKLRKWALQNEIKINPGKSKAVSFKKGRVKEQIRYYIEDQLILEANSIKYLGIIIRSDYTLRKA